MYIEIWQISLFLVAQFILVGLVFKYFLKPRVGDNFHEKFQEHDNQITSLKKKLTDIEGAEATLDKINLERKQNISLLKTQELIAKYNKWKKPVRNARVLLSCATAFITTVIIANIIQDRLQMQAIDFFVIAIFLFSIFYILWGNRMEATWKNDIQNKMKKEFDSVIERSTNPMKAKEKLSEWMRDHKDINEDMKKTIDDLLDKWLKGYLEED